MTPRRAPGKPFSRFVALAVLLPGLLLLASATASLSAPPGDLPGPAPTAAKDVAAAPDRAAVLAERERAIRADEERLLALRKEVEGKIAKYEKLLAEVEAREKSRREEDEAKVDQLVKLFEGMTPELAAPRLEALDEGMAAAILARMKGRKASNVLAVMEPKRAADLVRRMAAGVKKFPPQ